MLQVTDKIAASPGLRLNVSRMLRQRLSLSHQQLVSILMYRGRGCPLARHCS